MPAACSRAERSGRPGQRAPEPRQRAAGFRKPLPEARAPGPAGAASAAEAGPGGRALQAGSPRWLSWSLRKPPGAARPSLAICLKHLVIRCQPHTGAFKLKCAVTLPPTLAGAALPAWPSLCRREQAGGGMRPPAASCAETPRPAAPHGGCGPASRERLGLPQQGKIVFAILSSQLGGAGRKRSGPAVRERAPGFSASST